MACLDVPCWLWGVVRFKELVVDVFAHGWVCEMDVVDSENGLLITVVFCCLMDR